MRNSSAPSSDDRQATYVEVRDAFVLVCPPVRNLVARSTPICEASVMSLDVLATEDAAKALEHGRKFLESEPVVHNLVLTLLTARVRRPEPGRYWLAVRGGEVCGVAFQSPLDFVITITPMDAEIAERLVDSIVSAGLRPPGVSGEAGSAARLAGYWTERTKSAARPVRGERLYEIADVSTDAMFGTGSCRRATDGDRALLTDWFHGFRVDTGERPVQDPARTVADRVAAGHFWTWDDGGPVAMAALTEPVAEVRRVQAVYTPPENRHRGYASALVATLSMNTLRSGCRCVLYTDLGNPTSNSIYRKIGYNAVAEVTRYAFD